MSAHIPPLWSAECDKIGAAMFAFQQACPTVPKTETAEIRAKDNPSKVVKSYDYTDLASAAQFILPHLAASGLTWNQGFAGPYIATRIMHFASGQFCESYGPMPEPDRKGDGQAWGSLITYMRRYYLLAALGIVAEDEDDDGQKGSAKPDPRPAPARATAGERREAPRQAQRAPAPAARQSAAAQVWAPGRENKGKRVGQMAEKDLDFWIRSITENPGEEKYRAKNLEQLAAMLDFWAETHHGVLHAADRRGRGTDREPGDDGDEYYDSGEPADDFPPNF